MNKEFYKNKKFWIIVAVVIVVLIVLVSLILLISKKNNADNNNSSNSSTAQSNSDPKKIWPDLKEYDIADLNVGKIDNVDDNSNKNGYKLNYRINVISISKEDIEKYVKKFKSWTINESDYYYILVKSTDEGQYSVVITFNEEVETAEIVITSL